MSLSSGGVVRRLLVKSQCSRGCFVVDESVQKITLMAVRVTLQVHTLSDEIGGQVSNVTIVKLDSVNASVKDGVVIGLADGSTVGGVLARNNLTMLHFLAKRKEQFSQDIVVGNVRSRRLVIFKVGTIVGRVKVIREVRSQVRWVKVCRRWFLS